MSPRTFSKSTSRFHEGTFLKTNTFTDELVFAVVGATGGAFGSVFATGADSRAACSFAAGGVVAGSGAAAFLHPATLRARSEIANVNTLGIAVFMQAQFNLQEPRRSRTIFRAPALTG